MQAGIQAGRRGGIELQCLACQIQFAFIADAPLTGAVELQNAFDVESGRRSGKLGVEREQAFQTCAATVEEARHGVECAWFELDAKVERRRDGAANVKVSEVLRGLIGARGGSGKA